MSGEQLREQLAVICEDLSEQKAKEIQKLVFELKRELKNKETKIEEMKERLTALTEKLTYSESEVRGRAVEVERLETLTRKVCEKSKKEVLALLSGEGMAEKIEDLKKRSKENDLPSLIFTQAIRHYIMAAVLTVREGKATREQVLASYAAGFDDAMQLAQLDQGIEDSILEDWIIALHAAMLYYAKKKIGFEAERY